MVSVLVDRIVKSCRNEFDDSIPRENVRTSLACEKKQITQRY